jgi:carbon starvation protein CstA
MTELEETDKVVNIISLIIILVDILIYLSFAKNLLKTKTGNTILFFTVVFGLLGGIIMLYINSVASISLSSFILLLLLFFVSRKKLSGGKIEGAGLTNYKSFTSSTSTSRSRKRRRRR